MSHRFLESSMNFNRIVCSNGITHSDAKGPVVYLMSRDQRVADNWALLYAQQVALEMKKPLCVLFFLDTKRKNSYRYHYEFMIEGLKEVELSLEKKNIGFVKLIGKAEKKLLPVIKSMKASALIADFSPLGKGKHRREVLSGIKEIPYYEVDTHNVIPVTVVSNKQEYAARTFRPKYYKEIENYLTDFPNPVFHSFKMIEKSTNSTWQEYEKAIEQIPYSNKPNILLSGEEKAREMMQNFINNGLKSYSLEKNDPTKNSLSNLSAYLHFGQISAQRIAVNIYNSDVSQSEKDVFLEELLVRRELSDNFCFYNANYDSLLGAPNWALKTLKEHKSDSREYLYSVDELENAKTHDNLWNASQMEMVKTAKMHGYMRMYWAKKILEWSTTPEDAFDTALYLNDKYELDGRDPNGFVGILWSIAGLHDRPWFERPIHGLIRYMSYEGAKRKFDIKAYIDKINSI